MGLDKETQQGALKGIKGKANENDGNGTDQISEPVEPPKEPEPPKKELVKRMTVSLPPEVLENGKIIARMSNKNFSQYVCKLLEADALTENSQYLLRQNRNITKTMEKVTK